MKITLCIFFTCVALSVVAQKPRLVVPIGHIQIITSVAFSPDGQRVLTGSVDGIVKLWDLSGRVIQTFTGHLDGVNSVAFSPDGQKVLTGSLDGTVKLRDLSGRVIQTFIEQIKDIRTVAFPPDGQKVLTVSDGETALLWDLSGRVIQTFKEPASGVSSAAFSPDGQKILTGSEDGTVRLWDLSGHEIQTFTYTKGGKIWSLAFSPDGQKVLTGSMNGTVRLWNLSGQVIQTFKEHTNGVWSVAFSPDGQKVLTGSEDGTAKLWNLSGRAIQTFTVGDGKWISSVALSPDGQKVLTGNGDGTARLWDLSGREIQAFTGHSSGVVSSVAFSPTGHQVLTGDNIGSVKLWNLSGHDIQTLDGHKEGIRAVAFSPDGEKIITGGGDMAKLWDLSGQVIQTFTKEDCWVISVVSSSEGQRVFTENEDGIAKLWDLSGREIQTFSGHSQGVRIVDFSSDGQRVLTGSDDGTAKLWDLSGQVIQTFDGHMGSISSVALSSDGQKVLTGSEVGWVKLWDLSGQVIQTFTVGDDKWVSSLAFSPDGQKVLTGSGNGTLKLWDLSGREIQTFTGHTSGVWSVAFSPDGQKLLTGSEDNTAKLWNTNTGQCLATLIALDSSDWVVTTPSGLFDASPGAMNLLYFVVGKELDVIELEQLKERYYEPGLLYKVMGFSDEPLREVEGFDSVALYPFIRLQLDTLQNKLHIHLSPRNGGVGKVSVFINDKEIMEEANPLPRGIGKIRDTSFTIELGKYARYFLFDSLNTVSIRAYNEAGWLKSAAHSVEYRPVFAKSKGQNNSQGAVDELSPINRNPSLHILVVGSADYAGTDLDLTYAAKDARDMASALEQIGKQLFIPLGGEVTVHLLTTDTSATTKLPTKTNIKAAFEDIKKDDKAEDIVIVYFSGHGITYGEADRALFYYLTRDIGGFDLSDAGVREKRAISSDELTKWLNNTHARKQVLILDACNSGKMVEALAGGKKELSGSQIRALDRMKDRTGMFVLAGSAANKVSYEAGQYGQGLLTYSLLQGIKGLAHPNDERVDVMKLFQYSCDEVPELAKGIGGIQTPMLVGPLKGSFDIGIKNDFVHIKIADPKPVFIRNNFQNEDSFDDALGLTPALAGFFQEITTRGAQADLIYVDVSAYENAYSLKGLYKISGDVVVVRGRLFKGQTTVGEEFKVTGKKSDVPGLAEAILEQVMGMVK